MLDGKLVASVERSCPQTVQLPEVLVFFSQVTVLEIVVHAMGRNSGGCDWDFKGLVYPNIQLNGGWPHGFPGTVKSVLLMRLVPQIPRSDIQLCTRHIMRALQQKMFMSG